jgi:hypothetical protein
MEAVRMKIVPYGIVRMNTAWRITWKVRSIPATWDFASPAIAQPNIMVMKNPVASQFIVWIIIALASSVIVSLNTRYVRINIVKGIIPLFMSQYIVMAPIVTSIIVIIDSNLKIRTANQPIARKIIAVINLTRTAKGTCFIALCPFAILHIEIRCAVIVWSTAKTITIIARMKTIEESRDSTASGLRSARTSHDSELDPGVPDAMQATS